MNLEELINILEQDNYEEILSNRLNGINRILNSTLLNNSNNELVNDERLSEELSDEELSDEELLEEDMDVDNYLIEMLNNLELNQIRNNNIEVEETNNPLGLNGYNKLKEYRLWMGSNDSCSICLEKFKWLDSITELPCKHKYHTECIHKWFSSAATCPTCRYKINSENDSGYNIENINRNIRITFNIIENIVRNIT